MPYISTPPYFEWDQFAGGVDARLIEDDYTRPKVAVSHPLHFAFIYMKNAITDDDGLLSLNDLHIQMSDRAKDWTLKWGPGNECRHAWIAPRECGKSTWMFRILPLWAAAGGYRKFIAMFQDGGGNASNHFQNLRNTLRDNEMLRHDFPDLCTPSDSYAADRKDMYVSKGGHILMARGFDAANLGMNINDRRPDLILLDDIEPTGSQYSDEAKEQRLATLVEAILPLGSRAVINITGTTTRRGSMVHDLVRAAKGEETDPWVKRHKFTPHYFPAIVTDPLTGLERSIWDTKWSMEYLDSRRHDLDFKLNYMNDPDAKGGEYWGPADVKELPEELRASFGVLSIDPANTSKKTSDETGLAVVRSVRDEDDELADAAYIEEARGVRLNPEGLRKLVYEMVAARPYITKVILETNSAGDWIDLGEMPRRVKVIRHSAKRPKEERIISHSQNCHKGRVYQARGQGRLEDQQFAYPDIKHDDILDAATAGVDHILTGDAR
jgi:hypothetical protein